MDLLPGLLRSVGNDGDGVVRVSGVDGRQVSRVCRRVYRRSVGNDGDGVVRVGRVEGRSIGRAASEYLTSTECLTRSSGQASQSS